MEIDPELRKIGGDLAKRLSEFAELARIITGYVAIGLWYLYFKYVRLHIARRITGLLMTLATIELATIVLEKILAIHETTERYPHAGIHVWIDRVVSWMHNSIFDLPTVVIWTSVGTVITTYIVYSHHHRMARRVEQHLEFLDSLREVTSEATRLVISAGVPQEAALFIERVLQALVETTLKLKGRGPRSGLARIATLMETERNDPDGLTFVLRENRQWPAGTYNLQVRLPSASAAGKALEKPRKGGDLGNGLVYIPWTRFPHGTRHLVLEDRPRIEYVPDAFVDLGSVGEPTPKSIICTGVDVPEAHASKYVLCLDSNRTRCFGEVDFHATHLLASMIGMVIAELHHKTTAEAFQRGVS